jgi:hypothetical protein
MKIHLEVESTQYPNDTEPEKESSLFTLEKELDSELVKITGVHISRTLYVSKDDLLRAISALPGTVVNSN